MQNVPQEVLERVLKVFKDLCQDATKAASALGTAEEPFDFVRERNAFAVALLRHVRRLLETKTNPFCALHEVNGDELCQECEYGPCFDGDEAKFYDVFAGLDKAISSLSRVVEGEKLKGSFDVPRTS